MFGCRGITYVCTCMLVKIVRDKIETCIEYMPSRGPSINSTPCVLTVDIFMQIIYF